MADERRVGGVVTHYEVEPVQKAIVGGVVTHYEVEPVQKAIIGSVIVMYEVTPNTTVARAAMPVQII